MTRAQKVFSYPLPPHSLFYTCFPSVSRLTFFFWNLRAGFFDVVSERALAQVRLGVPGKSRQSSLGGPSPSRQLDEPDESSTRKKTRKNYMSRAKKSILLDPSLPPLSSFHFPFFPF